MNIIECTYTHLDGITHYIAGLHGIRRHIRSLSLSHMTETSVVGA